MAVRQSGKPGLTTGVKGVQKLYVGDAIRLSRKTGFAFANIPVSDLKKKRKEEALALAQLIYDVYKEERSC
jgi:hypothetical protein